MIAPSPLNLKCPLRQQQQHVQAAAAAAAAAAARIEHELGAWERRISRWETKCAAGDLRPCGSAANPKQSNNIPKCGSEVSILMKQHLRSSFLVKRLLIRDARRGRCPRLHWGQIDFAFHFAYFGFNHEMLDARWESKGSFGISRAAGCMCYIARITWE